MANDRNPEIGWQLSMAFGQGVGGSMMATRGALAKAFEEYGDSLQSDPEWLDKSVGALEFARLLGRLAAVHAASSGRCVIDLADIDHALSAVRRTITEPIGQCKITQRNTRPV